jgi:hypothetical protein
MGAVECAPNGRCAGAGAAQCDADRASGRAADITRCDWEWRRKPQCVAAAREQACAALGRQARDGMSVWDACQDVIA